jgi:hypothetical protein
MNFSLSIGSVLDEKEFCWIISNYRDFLSVPATFELHVVTLSIVANLYSTVLVMSCSLTVMVIVDIMAELPVTLMGISKQCWMNIMVTRISIASTLR